MRITEQSRYALIVLAALALRHPNAATVAEIAAETGITESNVFKLLKVIAKCGFVATTRGRGGGIRLASAPETITVGSIIRTIEPRFRSCGPAELLAAAVAPRSAIEDRTDEILGRGVRAFLAELDGITIAQVASAPPHHGQPSALVRRTAAVPA